MQEIDKLIQQNIGLIFNQLIKFNLVNDPEAESIGYEALLNAITNYDESRGTRLSTLATVYIYNALGSYVRSLRGKRQLTVVSYNTVISDEDTVKKEFIEFIASGENVEDRYIKAELHKATREAFNSSYDTLTNEKHKEILGIWRDSEFLASTNDISKQASVSQSYVSQVINNFKFILKKKLEDMYYD